MPRGSATSFEAIGGQSSIDYDVLDRSSQEAIFEIYQQLQNSGESNLLDKYETMVAKVIRDVNSFNKEKRDLEQALKCEKQKYNTYLDTLETDLENQIKDVENNVKKELNEKHQRELDMMRRQMELQIAELNENVSKFNEESARMRAVTANTTATAARRGSVTTAELASMKSQVTELTDQSNALRSELAAAQSSLWKYRQQMQDLISTQQNQRNVPDRHFTLDVGEKFGYRTPGSRSNASINQLMEASQEENSLASHRSSSRYSNKFDNGNPVHNAAHLAASPGDSGLGGAVWADETPTDAHDKQERKKSVSALPNVEIVVEDEDEENNLAAVLAAENIEMAVETTGAPLRIKPDYDDSNNNSTRDITPPEFTDPNNLPEHLQFKFERFQQSLNDFVERRTDIHAPNNRSRNNSRRHYAPDLQRPLLSTSSGCNKVTAIPVDSNNNSPHLFRRSSPMKRSQQISTDLGPELSVNNKSEWPVIRNNGNHLLASSLPKAGATQYLLQQQQRHQVERPQMLLRRQSSSNDNVFSESYSLQQQQTNNLYGGINSAYADRRNRSLSRNRNPRMPLTLEPERVFRVILAGDSCVGKSSILMRLVEDRFVNNLPTTLGVDFFTRLFQIDDDERRKVALQLWDTAGQERFRSLARSYFRRADGVLLVYDVTSEKTFLSVRDWVSIVRESTNMDVAIMICGNKADLRPFCANRSMRTVSMDDGQQLAESYNTLFTETSAKTGEGITEGIMELIKVMRTREDTNMQTAVLQLDEKNDPRLHTIRCSPIGASATLKRPVCS